MKHEHMNTIFQMLILMIISHMPFSVIAESVDPLYRYSVSPSDPTKWRDNLKDACLLHSTYIGREHLYCDKAPACGFDNGTCVAAVGVQREVTGCPTGFPEPYTYNPTIDKCENSIDLAKNSGLSSTCLLLKNPINVGTGNKFQLETDYQSSTPGGLTFRRYYNTQGSFLLRIGRGWFGDYWQRLNRIEDTVEIRRPDGRVLEYNLVGNQWIGDTDVVERLEELTDGQGMTTGWLVTLSDDSVEEYVDLGTVGILSTITDRNGLVTTVTQDLSVAEGGDGVALTVDLVTDAFGRALQFKYDGNNLRTLIDPAGNEIHYTQDVDRKLLSVTYPDETPLDTNDNPTRLYHYEDTNFPNYLTGITDETGNRFSTYAYNSEGRATLSEHAGGAQRITVAYNVDGTATVTDAVSRVQTYHFQVQQGMVRLAQVDGGECADCGNQIQAATYDANGFIASRTDFNSNQTTFVNNSRGLETSRTEAVGTAQERTITTEWHPTFRLPTKITEPGKETRFSYDAQGRLLERTEEEIAP